MKQTSKWSFLFIGISVGLFFIHYWMIVSQHLSIPFLDDWSFLPDTHSLRSFFEWHNEHRHVLLKALTLILYWLNGWNLITHQLINLLLFGFVVILVFQTPLDLANQYEIPPAFILLLSPFLFSPVNYQSYVWAVLTVSHLWLLFLFLSAHFLFKSPFTMRNLSIGLLCSLLSAYSHAGGVITALIEFPFLMFFIFKEQSHELEKKHSFIMIGIYLALLLLWFIGYRNPGYHPQHLSLMSKDFWDYFLNLLSLGFGITEISLIKGLGIFILVLFPIPFLFLRLKNEKSPTFLANLSLSISLIIALMVMSKGRGGFGIIQSKASRYAEFSLMIVPLAAGNWISFLGNQKNKTKIFLSAYGFLCFMTFLGSWHLFSKYPEIAERNKTRHECAENYYRNGGDGICPTIDPDSPLKERFDRAKKLNLSFYQEIKKKINESSRVDGKSYEPT